MEDYNYQIVHAIAGRTRIRIPWLKAAPTEAGKLQRLIESLSFVTSIRMNLLAQSIVILYRVKLVSKIDAEAKFIDAIQQCSPEPTIPEPASPNPVAVDFLSTPPLHTESSNPTPSVKAVPFSGAFPTPAPEPSVPPNSAQAQPAQAQPIASTHDASKKSNEIKPPKGDRNPGVPAKTSLVEDIPNPWDEPEEDKNPSLPPHSTASLSARLNTTSQAVTQRRKRPDFPSWTQSQDPDQVAWQYDVASQLFYPMNTVVPAVVPQAASSEPIPEIKTASLQKEAHNEAVRDASMQNGTAPNPSGKNEAAQNASSHNEEMIRDELQNDVVQNKAPKNKVKLSSSKTHKTTQSSTQRRSPKNKL